MSNTLESKAIRKLKSVFDGIDIDGNGTVSLVELKKACESLSITFGEEELRYFRKSDVSGDDELSFDEFCDFYIHSLKRSFKKIDSDKSGKIDATELQSAFKDLGFDFTLREVRALLLQVNKDKDESVDFKEFCNFFCYLPSPDFRIIVQQWASGLSLDTGTDLAPPPMPPASLVIWRALLAGGIAGVVSRTLTAPLEKIKIMAQTSNAGRIPIIKSLMAVWHTERLRGLLAGNGANCLRVFPFSALVCLAYANLAKQYPLDDSSAPYNVVWRMGTGAFAGMFATILTHPIDVIRAKLTVQSQKNKLYQGLFHGLKEVAAKEKLPGLYRGIGPTLLAIAPFMAVQQSSYDVLKTKAISLDIKPSASLFFICGSIAGAAAQTAVYPLDVIRRRMQVQQGFQHQKLSALFKTLQVQQLFYGLSATYLKVMPAAAISLLVRDAILGRLQK